MTALGLGMSLAPTTARAHHVPGHAASESARNLDGLLGGSAVAQSRLGLFGNYALAGPRRVASPGHTAALSLLGEYAPHPAVSFGVTVPWVFVQPIAEPVADGGGAGELVQGLGDTRVSIRVTPHARKLVHRVMTFGVDVTTPTRSFAMPSDPGRTWIVSPSVNFTRSYRHAYWQVLGLASAETRPAGTAVDLSAGAMAGWRFDGGAAVSAGAVVDVRVAAWCQAPGGSGAEYCARGRATEIERPSGATRAHARVTASWGRSPAQKGPDDRRARPGVRVFGSVQVPVTPRRDFDVAASAGTQVSF